MPCLMPCRLWEVCEYLFLEEKVMTEYESCGVLLQVKAPAGQSYTQEDIQCHVHYALYPSSNRDQLGDKRQRTADKD